jgi:hypothetical protein
MLLNTCKIYFVTRFMCRYTLTVTYAAENGDSQAEHLRKGRVFNRKQ